MNYNTFNFSVQYTVNIPELETDEVLIGQWWEDANTIPTANIVVTQGDTVIYTENHVIDTFHLFSKVEKLTNAGATTTVSEVVRTDVMKDIINWPTSHAVEVINNFIKDSYGLNIEPESGDNVTE